MPLANLLRVLLSVLVALLGHTNTGIAFAQKNEPRRVSQRAYDIARSNPDSSIILAGQALQLAVNAGNVPEQARAHAILGRSMIFKSNLAGLKREVGLAFKLLPNIKNDTLTADIYNLAALSYRFSHLPDSALIAIALAEKSARAGKMTTQLTNALLAKAALLTDKRLYAKALAAYEECYEIDTKKGDEIGQALDLQNLGQTLVHLQLTDEALKSFKTAIPIFKKLDDKHGLILTLISLSTVYAAKSMYDSATVGLTKAYALAGQMGDNIAQGAIANNLSSYAYDRNLLQQTRYWARKSITHYYATGDSARAASSLANLGEVERLEGNLAGAEFSLQTALQYANKLKQDKIIALSTKMLAKVYQAQKKYDKAADLYLQYASIQDTLFKNNLAEEIASTEGRHETFVKDQKIALLNKNIEVQNLSLREKDLLAERKTLLAALLFLGALGAFGLYFFASKRKALRLESWHQAQLLQEQALSHAASSAAEVAERKRIARELHDGVGQMIASVRLHMAARATPIIDYTDLEQMLAETSDEVRFISHNLMPEALERRGFDAAIKELIERIAKTKKLSLVPHIEHVGGFLDAAQAQMLYRVLQELISNVLKHAAATSLFITLANDDGDVCLTVEDDGKGFDQATLTKSGIGMENLKERVAAVGGQLEVESKPNQGTVVSVHIKVRQATYAKLNAQATHE